MKFFIVYIALLLSGFLVKGQSFESPQMAFNQAANQYIYENPEKAVKTLNQALKHYPEDKKLRELLEKILKDREQQQQQQQNKQDQKNQDQKDKTKQEQEQEQQQSKQEQQQDQDKENESQTEDQKQEEQKQQNQADQKSDEQKEAEEKEASPQNAQEDQNNENQDQKDIQEIQQNLEELNISPEKARMILEAMKNNEIQYIQQMQRKSNQRPDDGKPDW